MALLPSRRASICAKCMMPFAVWCRLILPRDALKMRINSCERILIPIRPYASIFLLDLLPVQSGTTVIWCLPVNFHDYCLVLLCLHKWAPELGFALPEKLFLSILMDATKWCWLCSCWCLFYTSQTLTWTDSVSIESALFLAILCVLPCLSDCPSIGHSTFTSVIWLLHRICSSITWRWRLAVAVFCLLLHYD